MRLPDPVTASAAARSRLEDRRRVEVRGEQELGHLLLHVGAEPGHRGELGPVGLLVQADPAAEVAGVHAQLPLDHHDVGRDQRQAPGRGILAGGVRVGRQEQLVLAEDPAGQVGEDQARLHPGDPRPDGRDDGRAGRRAALGHLLDQRVEHHAEAVDVGPDPAGPVHDGDNPVVGRAGQAGQLPDRLGDLGGQLPELGHHRPGLAQRDLRPGPDPADARRGGHVPVDHLRAAHPPTVRARTARRPAGAAPGRSRVLYPLSAAAAGQRGGHLDDLHAARSRPPLPR